MNKIQAAVQITLELLYIYHKKPPRRNYDILQGGFFACQRLYALSHCFMIVAL